MTGSFSIDSKAVEALIRDVGAYQMSHFRKTDYRVMHKSSAIDMVTEVDLESERRLVEWIDRRYPDHDIVTEERPPLRKGSDYTWIIDPLDGTTNYASGLPIFAISVALHHRGRREMGWVHLPFTGEMYSARCGGGATYNGHPLEMLGECRLEEALVATGFPYDRRTNPDNNVREASRVIPEVRGFRRLGAAAYDLCLIAQGVYDGFWERGLKPWDVEAGLLLIEEVGGRVSAMTTPGGHERLVVGKPGVVKELLSILDKD